MFDSEIGAIVTLSHFILTSWPHGSSGHLDHRNGRVSPVLKHVSVQISQGVSFCHPMQCYRHNSLALNGCFDTLRQRALFEEIFGRPLVAHRGVSLPPRVLLPPILTIVLHSLTLLLVIVLHSLGTRELFRTIIVWQHSVLGTGKLERDGYEQHG